MAAAKNVRKTGNPLPKTPSVDSKGTVQGLKTLLSVFREVDPEMPAQQMMVLLAVAEEPDLTMAKLAEVVGISQSSTSRNVAALAQVHRKGLPGHDLVFAYEDPMERRRKLVRLTSKGTRLMAKVEEAMAQAMTMAAA